MIISGAQLVLVVLSSFALGVLATSTFARWWLAKTSAIHVRAECDRHAWPCVFCVVGQACEAHDERIAKEEEAEAPAER